MRASHLLIVAGMLCASPVVLAQIPDKKVFAGEQKIEEVSLKKMLDGRVLEPSGKKLGSVKDILLDKRSGQLESFVVEVGGFLGVGGRQYKVPASLFTVTQKGNSPEAFTLTAKLSKNQIKALPEFKYYRPPKQP